jgi:hypothetical protein
MKKAKFSQRVAAIDVPTPQPALSVLTHLAAATLAAACAPLQFRLLVLALRPDYGRSIEAALRVVTGHPHWRVYQNRVLGPYLVQGLSHLFPNFAAAHVFYTITTLSVAGYLTLIPGDACVSLAWVSLQQRWTEVTRREPIEAAGACRSAL